MKCAWFALPVLAFGLAISVERPSHARSGEDLYLGTVTFEIPGLTQRAPLDRTLVRIKSLLLAYQPVAGDSGATLSGKSVESPGPRGVPRVVFKAEKSILFSTIVAEVRGDVFVRELHCAHATISSGYRVELDLSASNEPVTANASRFFVDLCMNERVGHPLQITGTSFMTEGPDYGIFAGPKIKSVIQAQIKPLIEALKHGVIHENASQ